MFRDLSEIKARLTAQEVLKLIGYEKSKPRRNGKEIRDACPVHEGDDPNLSISEDGSWFCHSHGCKGGDLISLYQQAKRIGFTDAIEQLENYLGLTVERSLQSEQNRVDSFEKQEKFANSKTQEFKEKAAALEKSCSIALEIWESASDTGDTSYFDAKGIETPVGVRYGNRYGKQKGPCVIVPMYNIEGRLQSVQYVRKGEKKLFATGTKAKGAFFPLGLNLTEGLRTLYLCEGIATACSVFEALNRAIPTLSCGSASNVVIVAKAIKEKWPEIEVIVCLDDDAAGNESARKVRELGLPGILFRRPNFEGLERSDRDKDFNDLYKLVGAEKVREQLREERLSSKDEAERDSILSAGKTSIKIIESHYQTVPPGIHIGLKIGNDIHEKILFPAGAYSVFCAPTKHGKTAALVNSVDRYLWKDSSATAVFITLEELEPPVLIRFLSRFLNEELSKNNALTLSSYFRSKENRFAMFSKDWKKETRDGDPSEIFLKNVEAFENLYLKTGRLRVLSFNSFDGVLSQVEQLCKKIEEFKKWIPGLRMIAIDYLQLLGVKKPGNRSRDEVLKEVCLQLKDMAAKTGLVILTAAQFNRTIQNEEDLHPSAIGEAGSIERHAALVIGMWNRRFKQMNNGKLDSKKETSEEILLSIMLNRYGPSGQRLVVPYNGSIGLIDFENAELTEEKSTNPKAESKVREDSTSAKITTL